MVNKNPWPENIMNSSRPVQRISESCIEIKNEHCYNNVLKFGCFSYNFAESGILYLGKIFSFLKS